MKTADDTLSHFGVKGMRWGVRRDANKAGDSDDHTRAKSLRKKSRFGKTRKLTNDELRTVIERMNLEKQYGDLKRNTGGGKAGKIAEELLVNLGKEHARKALTDGAGKVISGFLKK